MKLGISIPEAVEIFKEIQEQPEKLFTMIRVKTSNANKALIDGVEKWRTRDLCGKLIKYLFLDGVNFDMRIYGSVEKLPVLVAIGVTKTGKKLVLGLSAPTWREFFKDLKGRGLDGSHMIQGIMDSVPGLEKVFKEKFPKTKVQRRCQVHACLCAARRQGESNPIGKVRNKSAIL
jgi:transposase-like protein